MSRGKLRIYLGAAPGVGKTFAMLNEGRRRAERGTDVVVAYVETHGRPSTAAQLGDLEVVPRRTYEHRGTVLEELDLDAVLARRPAVALVDELAHTNAPGTRHPKRWADVQTMLEAGIDVITTVNVQHLESLNDVVERITGVRQAETVPDWVVRDADQVELVDMTPEALRRRMAHGNIYGPDKVDAALANYFRVGNLSALRELALLWVADKVEDALVAYMADHDIDHSWETRERVVVAVTGAPSGETLIRRAARMAQRSHGDLLGVHVQPADGLTSGPSALLVEHRQLLADLGGDFHEITTSDVATGLADFARSVHATQLVLGATQRSRWAEFLHGSIINKVIRLSGEIDVHVISQPPADGDDRAGLPQLPARRRSALPARRRSISWAIAAVGLPLLTAVLLSLRDTVDLSTVLLSYLLLVGVVAGLGGLRVGLVSALAAVGLSNWFFTQPYGTLHISDPEQIVALVAFVAIGLLVSLLVGTAARRAFEAQRARAEAEALAAAAGQVTSVEDPLVARLAHLRLTFDQRAVALLRRADGDAWLVEASDGEPVPRVPTDGETVPLADDLVLCIVPGGLGADDRRVLDAFVARVADVLERRALERAAQAAAARQQADELRTAILRAVSHDLRTPLASIKASSTSLLQTDVSWTADQQHEFLATIDEEADRLARLIENLLDMSRIEAGAVEVATRPVGLDDVVAAALDSLSAPTDDVIVAVDVDVPDVLADPGLLERVIANLVANALAHTPADRAVRVEGASLEDRAVVRIIDRGPGIDERRREQAFAPFQRLGDQVGSGSVGLGLAIARGFMTAMGGGLTIDDTPGGGLTVTLDLPADRSSQLIDVSEVTG